MAQKAAFSQSLSYSATDTRRAVLAGMARVSAAALTWRAGVVPGGAASLQVASTGGMAVSVALGQAVVDQYVVTNDATQAVILTAGGASARTDLIVLRVRDTEAGDGVSSAAIEIVQGAAGGAVPATPARSIVLAQIAVAASASSITGANITDRRQRTTAIGGMLYLPGALAVAPTSDLVPGQPIWDPQAGRIGIVNEAANGWIIFTSGTPGAWQLITLASGYTLVASATTAAVRKEGSRVQAIGRITGTMTGTVTIGTVPAGYRAGLVGGLPNFDFLSWDVPCGSGRARLRHYATGELIIDNMTLTGAQAVDISAASWPWE